MNLRETSSNIFLEKKKNMSRSTTLSILGLFIIFGLSVAFYFGNESGESGSSNSGPVGTSEEEQPADSHTAPPSPAAAAAAAAVPTKEDGYAVVARVAAPVEAADSVLPRKALPKSFVIPQRGFTFDLCRPRCKDEDDWFHGGVPLPARPPSFSDNRVLTRVARRLFENFRRFDFLEQQKKQKQKRSAPASNSSSAADLTVPVMGVPCVGSDCSLIFTQQQYVDAAIGHLIVALGTTDEKLVRQFTALADAFPGRFSVFVRPEKLSCAESWNLFVRLGFSIRPMPDFVFIANADWHPVETQDRSSHSVLSKPVIPVVTSSPPEEEAAAAAAAEEATVSDNRYKTRPPTSLEQFARSARERNLVAHRFYHFTSFALMRKGFLELGYFDEVLYPALAEDVEFHLKAVSKGMGDLGSFDPSRAHTVHIRRASEREAIIKRRQRHMHRDGYLRKKWGVALGQHKDFRLAKPFKHPFNIPYLKHNNSWIVDKEHRRCIDQMALTERHVELPVPGLKLMNRSRGAHGVVPTTLCWWNPESLRDLLPITVRKSFEFVERLTSEW